MPEFGLNRAGQAGKVTLLRNLPGHNDKEAKLTEEAEKKNRDV